MNNLYKPIITLSGFFKISGLLMMISIGVCHFVSFEISIVLPIISIFAGIFTEKQGGGD